jgi:hypothetical protein
MVFSEKIRTVSPAKYGEAPSGVRTRRIPLDEQFVPTAFDQRVHAFKRGEVGVTAGTNRMPCNTCAEVCDTRRDFGLKRHSRFLFVFFVLRSMAYSPHTDEHARLHR